jgi:outer membrane lipoprotein-sorting protein
MRIRKAVAIGMLALTPALTGCLVHTHSVLKTRPPDIVRNATLDQLLKQVDARYDAVQSMQLKIQMAISTGGSVQGVVKEYTSLPGYIVIGKPEDIRVILLLPLVQSDALDMVSDGNTFKMHISFPTRNCAIVGSDVVNSNSQKGLYSLRPAVVLDPLLIRGLRSNQVVSMTQDSRTYPDPKKRKQLIEEPDYDIEYLSQPRGEVASTLRVLHVSRANLLPWRLDIYNADGKIETQASYSSYQKFGDIDFPTKIVIQRPLDELGLTITVGKALFNQSLAADEFKLDIPDGIPVTNMDDPVSAAIAPCSAHAPQSPH